MNKLGGAKEGRNEEEEEEKKMVMGPWESSIPMTTYLFLSTFKPKLLKHLDSLPL